MNCKLFFVCRGGSHGSSAQIDKQCERTCLNYPRRSFAVFVLSHQFRGFGLRRRTRDRFPALHHSLSWCAGSSMAEFQPHASVQLLFPPYDRVKKRRRRRGHPDTAFNLLRRTSLAPLRVIYHSRFTIRSSVSSTTRHPISLPT